MTDVKRWVDDGASESVQRLLSAAREERPAEAGIQRTLVAIGVGSAVATGASHAAGSAAAASLTKSAAGASTLALVTKWGVIGAVGAVATFGAVEATTRAVESARQTTVVSPSNRAVPSQKSRANAAAPGEPATFPAPADVEPDPEVEAPPLAAARPAKVPLAAAPERSAGDKVESPADSEKILEEVRVIDRARSALSQGDGRGTLAAIDGYRNGFSERRFEPEALYLRMEALVELGDAVGAKAAANRLLSAFPNAPQAARAKIVAADGR